jgi:hypothetical protein
VVGFLAGVRELSLVGSVVFTAMFDSQHYQKKKGSGSGTGSTSLVSTTEELLDRKIAALV